MPIQNGGLNVATTIFTTYKEDGFPVVESNYVKGGVHYLTSSQYFSDINVGRREWGMLVYTYDENKYYKLIPTFPTTAPDKGANENFLEFKMGTGSDEWVDSIQGIYDGPSNIPTNLLIAGNRFICGTNSSETFTDKDNKIAIYEVSGGVGGYSFIDPPDGCTVRVDDKPNFVYFFKGTNSITGKWYYEIQNTVRYIYPTSNNGLTFSYTTDGQTPIGGYTYCVFYASFATSNSGAASLSVDGNAYATIKKVSSNTLVDLSANDFGSNIEYQLTYDNGIFQIALPSAGSGGSIGPAEDNDYDDGLYTDFDPNTPIGTPIDRFNQILKALVPPAAPNLNSWSVTNQSEFVSGKVSYTNAQAASNGWVNTSTSPYTQAEQGDLYDKNSPSVYRLGVTDKTGVVQGILNSGVVGNSNLPVPAYATYSFGNGITGSVVLYINSITASTVDLGSSTNALSNLNNNGQLSVTAATNSRFSNGSIFDLFWWRTGTYSVNKGSSYVNNGFNQIQVKHILPSSTLTLTSYEFIVDPSTVNTELPVQTESYNLSTPKYLSGIQYYTTGNITYKVRALNIYRNTYYPSSNAGTFFDDTTTSQSKSSIYKGPRTYDTESSSNNAFSPNPSTEALGEPTDVDSHYDFETDFEIVAGSNVRKIDGGATFKITAKRTVQSEVTGGALSIGNLFIDNYNIASTSLEEKFNTESFRLPNSTSYDNVSSFETLEWDETASLLTGYTNALQVADGRLLYPAFNFSNKGSLSTNPNFGFTTTRNYQNCDSNVSGAIHGGASGHYRTYTRRFNLGSTSYAKFSMNISFANTSFVQLGTDLNTALDKSRVYVEFKLPYKTGTGTPNGGLVGGSVTGWMDACKSLDPQVPPSDGKGCLEGSVPSNGVGWKINFGPGKFSVFSGGYVLMRITSGKNWDGYISNIDITPG